MKKKAILSKSTVIAAFLLMFLVAACLIIFGAPSKTALADEVTDGPAIWDGTAAAAFTGGTGTKTDPFQIATGGQLAFLAEVINDGTDADTYNTSGEDGTYYALTNNIYLNDTTNWQNWSNQNPDSTTLSKWIPIGGEGNPFAANFSGRGFAVLGVYIKNTNGDNFGFFGRAENCVISGLNLKQGYISGDDYVGGIAGFLDNSTVTSCTNTATINGRFCIGGIVGYLNATLISRCTNEGAIIGGERIGGIAGYLDRSTITACHNTYYNTDGVRGSSYMGGIAGIVAEASAVLNCSNEATLLGSNYVGGVAGSVGGSVYNCYNSAAPAGGMYVGGVAGSVEGYGSVYNCYNSAAPAGGMYVGGVAGMVTGQVAYSYYYYSMGTTLMGQKITGIGYGFGGSGVDTTAPFDNEYRFESPYTNVYLKRTTLVSALNAWSLTRSDCLGWNGGGIAMVSFSALSGKAEVSVSGFTYNRAAANAQLKDFTLIGDWQTITYQYSLKGTLNWVVDAPANAGTYYARAVLTGSLCRLYPDLTTASVEFAISRKDITISWENYSDLVYDKTAKSVSATITGGVIEGDEVTIEAINGNRIAAGTYTATASLDGADAGNYALPANKTQSYTIAPIEVTVVWNNYAGLIYDGTAKSVSAAVLDGILAEDTVNVTVSGGSQTNAGTNYTATATLRGADAGNYVISLGSKTQTYSIAKAPYAGTAPAEAESVTATSITLKKIQDAEYSIDDGATWQNSNVFDDLESNTKYTISVRVKETDNVFISAVASIDITTQKPAKSGLPVGAIVGIIAGSVAAVAGGFAVYWFVIKKKKVF